MKRTQRLLPRAPRPTLRSDGAISAQNELLAEIAALLLEHGITPAQTRAVMEVAFARVAARTARLKNGRTSYSRVAAKTGLRRSNVRGLLSETTVPCKPSPVQRLVLGWRAEFLDSSGKPLRIVLGRKRDKFSRLARTYAPDIPRRALIDELTASGLASLRNNVLALRRLPKLESRHFDSSLRALLIQLASRPEVLGSE